MIQIQIILGAVVMGLIYTMANRFGLVPDIIRSKEQKELEKAEDKTNKKLEELWNEILSVEENLRSYKGFDTGYWEGVTQKELLFPSQAQDFANNLEEYLTGWFGDDETLIYQAFRDIGSPEHLSQVSYYYLLNHKENLIDKLTADLDGGELVTVYSIIKEY